MSSHEYSNGQQGQPSPGPSPEEALPSPERDIYGGHTDVDLYNQTPAAYGTLYLLKDFGGNLQANIIDIDWMSTDLYSTTTVRSPLESEGDNSQGGSSPSPSPSPNGQ